MGLVGDPGPGCIGPSCASLYGVWSTEHGARSTEYGVLCVGIDFPEIEPTRTFRRTLLTVPRQDHLQVAAYVKQDDGMAKVIDRAEYRLLLLRHSGLVLWISPHSLVFINRPFTSWLYDP